jgi:hypothetical protein
VLALTLTIATVSYSCEGEPGYKGPERFILLDKLVLSQTMELRAVIFLLGIVSDHLRLLVVLSPYLSSWA